MEVISGFSRLGYLSIADTLVTDKGSVHLESLLNLMDLDIDGTKISDGGLKHLEGLQELERLHVDIDKLITDEGVDQLKVELPNCYVW